MKFQAILSMAGVLSICTCAPIYQPQLGIIASNSNEVLRLNGLTLTGMGLAPAQGGPFFSPFLIQQQPPQVLNFNPGLQGPFFPPQVNQLNPAQLPPLQQDQAGLSPNNGLPAQNPPPGFPFFLTNLYPLRTPVRLIPNQNIVPNIQGQATLQPMQPIQPIQPLQPIQPMQPIQPIQPIQNRGKAVDSKVTSAPDYRGDRPGPGTGEGRPGFPLFEP